jgi:hypothetical protein
LLLSPMSKYSPHLFFFLNHQTTKIGKKVMHPIFLLFNDSK